MKVFSHGCTLDCFDTCKFNVHVNDGVITKVEGDKNHPYTKGLICIKGKKHLERLNHKDRVQSPLKKTAGKWVEIDFIEAISIIKERLLFYRENYGSNSVVHYSESGSGSVLKGIENVFFNFYGGITLSKGSTCWGAGIAAQKYDFGDVLGHSLEDMLNSESIIVWGRNPANTSLHLYSMLKEAKKRGTVVVVIDPIYTATAKMADIYVRVNPSTDGALAMAMAKVIIEEDLINRAFISAYVKGYDEFSSYLSTLKIEYLASECGVPIETIKKIARLYAGEKPVSIYPGYGLQKHFNGGNTIRAIDALAALTGNIGRPGGGVNYANRVYPEALDLDPYNSAKFAENQRYFDVSGFYEFITGEKNPPVKALFISKANPLTQFPELNRAREAFRQIEFKVCFDLFMTDTARYCDLFIPCTNTFESEDIVYTSMGNPYIIYNEKIVEPKNKLMDEYFFFQELAAEMEMMEYPRVGKREYLQKVVKPLEDRGITLEKIQNGYVTIQDNSVAWSELVFKTPSGKIEIYSEKAREEGLSPIPVYISAGNTDLKQVRLITSHPANSIFSQHYLDVEGMSQAYINPGLADSLNIKQGDPIVLKSGTGEIKVEARLNGDVPENVIHMYTGWWEKHGNPNFLTTAQSSEMGGQIAYYDTNVEIKKVNQ